MGQKIKSLLTSNAFWKGFLSAYDIWPTRTSTSISTFFENKDLAPEEIDFLSIKNDWDTVYSDLKKSIKQYGQQKHAS